MKSMLPLLCAAALAAQAPSAPAAETGYVMPETEWWDLTAEDGAVYRIYGSHPQGEAPKDGYPVLFVLDGNAMFGGFA